MITLNATTFDLAGSLSIDPLPNGVQMPQLRRVNRVATLDGGVAVNDRGHAHGDRDLSIRYKAVSAAHDAQARYLMANYARVTVAMPEGVFEAAPQQFDAGPTNTLTLLILSKLSED